MLADEVGFVIGVDTHADRHALALVEANTQRMRRQLTIPCTRRGYRHALRLARRQAPGTPRLGARRVGLLRRRLRPLPDRP